MNRNYVFIIVSLLCAFSLVLVGCGSNSSGGGAAAVVEGKTPGTFVVAGAGGDSTDEYGGDGGYIELQSYRDITVSKSGSVDASFKLPSTPGYRNCSKIAESGFPGDMAEEFRPKTSMTVEVVVSGTDLKTAGSYYLLYDDNTFRVDSDGDGLGEFEDEDVDCITIPTGVTVTFSANYDQSNGGGATGADEVRFDLDGDLLVAGTLISSMVNAATPDNDEGYCDDCEDRSEIDISAHQIFIAKTGLVDASGGDADHANEHGGSSWGIWLDAQNNDGGYMEILGKIDASGGDDMQGKNNDGGDGGGIDLGSDGILYIAGTLDCSGGDGENDGGDACYYDEADGVDIDAGAHIFFTGKIDATGGDGAEDDGGEGGYIDFYSNTASINLAGAITTDGGMGGTGDPGRGKTEWLRGGDAGDIYISTDEVGAVRVSTVMSAVGGDAQINGSGGDGGYFETYSYGADFLFSGSFNGSGGKGNDTTWDCDWCTSGGDADSFYVYVDYDSDYGYGEYMYPGNIEVGGNIVLSGGSSKGGDGGDGGYIYLGNDVDADDYIKPSNAGKISMKGYASFDFSGGNSVTGDGGYGGDDDWGIYVTTGGTEYMDDVTEAPGSIYWGVPTDISGGNGAMFDSYSAGYGGDIYFNTDSSDNNSDGDDSYNRGTLDTVVVISADIDASGGKADQAGDGGYADIYGYNLVDISAKLDVSGGDGLDDGGYASDDWSDVEIYATENIAFTGELDVSGGNGRQYGGDSTNIYIQAGTKSTVTGKVDASGGDAIDFGGHSGQIDILSQLTASEVTLGNIDITPGSGSTPGDIGYLLIDWVDYSPVSNLW